MKSLINEIKGEKRKKKAASMSLREKNSLFVYKMILYIENAKEKKF